MKKAAAVFVAVAMAACAITGCQPKKKDISNAKVTQQKSDAYDSAIKECFEAMYSLGGAETFYSYMYPDAALEAMKASGEYDKLSADFNDGQEKSLRDGKKYTFGGITEAKELSDNQTEGVKNYFAELSSPFVALKEDELTINDGYEVKYKYLADGKEAGEESVIVVSLNNEGWKIITH